MTPRRGLLAMISASAILCTASAGTAAAQAAKPWRNGILEAKADAGFIMMADKGGFAEKRGLKMDTVQVKAGATLTALNAILTAQQAPTQTVFTIPSLMCQLLTVPMAPQAYDCQFATVDGSVASAAACCV